MMRTMLTKITEYNDDMIMMMMIMMVKIMITLMIMTMIMMMTTVSQLNIFTHILR